MMGQVLSAFLGVFSFAILFHAPRRSYLACAAWGCYLLAAPMGLFLATTLAAIVLTLLSRMLSIALKMPSTVFIVTGIFPLVPGAGIYHTAYALVSRNMEALTLRGMQTLALAGAIALGILIGMGFPKLLVELGYSPPPFGGENSFLSTVCKAALRPYSPPGRFKSLLVLFPLHSKRDSDFSKSLSWLIPPRLIQYEKTKAGFSLIVGG